MTSLSKNIIPPGVEYHRVLAGEKRRIGRGILAIILLMGGTLLFGVVLIVVATSIDTALGTDGRATYTPLMHLAGMASGVLLIPWSMFLQRWLYGVRGGSLRSVISKFRFEIFGRALIFILPAWVVVMAIQYWAPLPETAWTHSDVLWILLITLLVVPLQSAGEEFGFRGLIFRVAGSWTNGARAGLAVGVLVSSVAFAIVHLSTDVWLNAWYLIFAAGTALITWRTGGLETAIVLHAGFNTLAFVFEAAFRANLDPAAADRAAGAGSPALLIPAVVVVIAAVVVWIRTRRRGPALTPSLEALP